MASAIEAKVKPMEPMAIEPYDREWGVGISGITGNPFPFPRINRILKWLNFRRSPAGLNLYRRYLWKRTDLHTKPQLR